MERKLVRLRRATASGEDATRWNGDAEESNLRSCGTAHGLSLVSGAKGVDGPLFGPNAVRGVSQGTKKYALGFPIDVLVRRARGIRCLRLPTGGFPCYVQA